MIAETFRPSLFVDGLEFVAENPGLVWEKTVDHLVLSGAAIGVALLLAIPLGVWLGPPIPQCTQTLTAPPR